MRLRAPFLLAALLAAACSGETSGPTPSRPLDYVVGRVLDGRSERAIPSVDVYTNSNLVTRTDSTGRYEAAAGYHPVDEWEIHFRKEGYKPKSYDMPESGTRDSADPTRIHLDVVMNSLP